MQEASPSRHAHYHPGQTAAAYQLHLQWLRFGASLADVKPIVCTLAQCRDLTENKLTGTLPAAWSAMASLVDVWVPCRLLIPLVPSCCVCSAVCDAHADGHAR